MGPPSAGPTISRRSRARGPAAVHRRAPDRRAVGGWRDVTSADALAPVRGLADGLTAVRGNIDLRDLGLPAVDTLEAGRVSFLLTHGTGSPDRYEERVGRAEAAADAVGVAGHTHEVLDAVVDGVRLLTPGSVTGTPPAHRPTMMTVEVSAGSLDVTVHERED